MPSTVDRVTEIVRNAALVKPSERVLVLLSGGPDSVCLAHLLTKKIKCLRVGALHINYGLRADADTDEQFCRNFCEGYEINFWAYRGQLPADGNLQSLAREARYRRAAEVASTEGFDLIATGHTAGDQVETVIYRLASSPGRRALLGIAAQDGRVVRPLLKLPAQLTQAYCCELGLEWREDVSNQSLEYTRNRIRHQIVPKLREIHPAAEENILATHEQLADENVVIDEVVEKVLAELATGSEHPTVDGKSLVGLNPALQRLVVRELAERAADGRRIAISAERATEIVGLVAKGGTAKIDLGPVCAVSQYGVLSFKQSGEQAQAPKPVHLAVPGSCDFGPWGLAAERLQRKEIGDLVHDDDGEALLDGDRLDKLVVRSWTEGDKMQPLGMSGSKLLQDIFTDRKVPRALRRQLPVVEVDGQIAWVAGVAVSEKFKIDNYTETVVKVTAKMAPASSSSTHCH